ncbi:MarR family winged helix-turn-helix transcriptional regulator [Schumannella luteola]
MHYSDDALEQLATRLISAGSRFARGASRRSGESRPLVALRVLSNLEQSGALRVGELASREVISQPAMTTTLNRLEGDGLVARRSDESDARASVISLTDAGRAELAEFRARAATAVRPAIEQLSTDDRAVLDRAATLLEQLVDELEATR